MAFQYRKDLEGYLDHEITLKTLKFILSLTDKLKPFFLLSSTCMFPESNGTKS